VLAGLECQRVDLEAWPAEWSPSAPREEDRAQSVPGLNGGMLAALLGAACFWSILLLLVTGVL
jgi:hypothetical protein